MHLSNGRCLKCHDIFDRYPSFNLDLLDWFQNIQSKHPDAHVSCAGRGAVDQDAAFQRGASRAKFGQSSHNYNAAIDVFQLEMGRAIWHQEWFDRVIGGNLTSGIKWYGAVGSEFFELPHCELREWKKWAEEGLLKLVE